MMPHRVKAKPFAKVMKAIAMVIPMKTRRAIIVSTTLPEMNLPRNVKSIPITAAPIICTALKMFLTFGPNSGSMSTKDKTTDETILAKPNMTPKEKN